MLSIRSVGGRTWRWRWRGRAERRRWRHCPSFWAWRPAGTSEPAWTSPAWVYAAAGRCGEQTDRWRLPVPAPPRYSTYVTYSFREDVRWSGTWQLWAHLLLLMSTEQPQMLAKWLIWRHQEKRKILVSVFCIFQPIAVENLAAFSCTTLNFISELVRRIYMYIQSEEVREGTFLFQHISIAIQCFNSVLLHDILVANLPDP